MMYLLDSQVIVWALTEPDKLNPQVLSIFDPGGAVRYVSPLSLWELEIKRSKGKISYDFSYQEMLRGLAARELPLSSKHVEVLRGLPRIHNDPFDRMLIAQAMSEGLTLVTADARIPQYPVRILKA
jgi:PIN domain nuclease of toxin-antitoxin system